MSEYDYDVIIIGFGKGGKTLAAECAGRGRKVALIERSDGMYGGTCINIGCIPTKVLVKDAKSAPAGEAPFSRKLSAYRDAIARKNAVTGFLRQKNYDNLAGKELVTVFTGQGSFRSPHEVNVAAKDKTFFISGDKIVINTGSDTVFPPISGLRDSRYVRTSTGILDESELPERLVIIGGGYIGLEFASMYAEFGSRVTVLEGGPRLIPREDEDIAASVRASLEKKGVTFVLNADVRSVKDADGGADVVYGCENGECSAFGNIVLPAVGRKPYTEGLRPEAAGVALNERGAVAVNERLQTSVPHIWAVGDVVGGLQFTYVSLDDSRVLRDAFFGKGERTTADRDPVPYTVFIDPPLARIGMNEDDARKAGLHVNVATLPAAAVPCARVLDQTEGMLKAVVDAESGRILGCALHCADAGEVINSVSIAMKAGRDFTFLRDMVFTHPSMNEALNDLLSQIQ